MARELGDSGSSDNSGRALVFRLSGDESATAIEQRPVRGQRVRDQGSGRRGCARGAVAARSKESESSPLCRRSEFRGGGGDRRDRGPKPQHQVIDRAGMLATG